MKKIFSIFIVSFFSYSFIAANDINLLDVDIDSIFDETFTKNTPNEDAQDAPSVISEIKKRGIELNASFNFKGAINPGWEVYPWELTGDEEFSWAWGIEMKASMDVVAQISEYFRVKSVVSYGIPDFNLSFGDFFFDYNFFNIIFLRAGKYEQSWGVSPNYSFTNLLSRVAIQGRDKLEKESPFYDPNAIPSDGTSYIIKLDIPIGIGGFQLLAMTRAYIADLASVEVPVPTHEYIGYGGKFNLALKWADFNFGVFYQDYMATRTFLSIKSNIFNTDVYNEWLVGINNHSDNSVGFAVNIGFTRSFFNNKLQINGEYFYNGEESTHYYRPESELRGEETLPFLEGHNFAFNFLYRFNGKINPRVFTSFLYGDDSYSLIFGVRINPFPNIEVYLAVPFGIGDGHYYNNMNNYNSEHRPFSILLYVNFNGGVRLNHYY